MRDEQLPPLGMGRDDPFIVGHTQMALNSILNEADACAKLVYKPGSTYHDSPLALQRAVFQMLYLMLKVIIIIARKRAFHKLTSR